MIDEDAVRRLRAEKDTEKERADKAMNELYYLRSDHNTLSSQWNALWKEPEYNEAAKRVKERKSPDSVVESGLW